MIKIVSFDLDGTLVKPNFADKYWLEGLPKIYAREKNVSIEEAKVILFRDYESIGKERIEWYKPSYWFNRYNLKYDWRKLLREYEAYIETYPDTLPTVKKLKGRYELIIISNAERNFIDVELKKTGLYPYFSAVFSTVSDFGMVKKNADVYRKVCSLLNVKEMEMVHVGDDAVFDYEVPKSIGIKAIHLDRKLPYEKDCVINSLTLLPNLINKF